MHSVLRTDYERLSRVLLDVSEESIIRNAVNSLLAFLYKPNEEVGWRADGAKLRRLGLDDEAINWGDLACVEVERLAAGGFIVTIEEASPEATKLCRWIQGWLAKWGWTDTRVRTEW